MRLPILLPALATLLLLPAAARAQPASAGPSFDCAKAASPTEKAICRSPDLSALDRRMADAYRALRGRLEGAPRDHLQTDQTRWLRAVAQACGGIPADRSRTADDCLTQRYESRIARLAALGAGPYPFVGELALVRQGSKTLNYLVDAAYPVLEAPGIDAAATNKAYATQATEDADSARPQAGLPPSAPGGTGFYLQSFTIERPVPGAVAIQLFYEGFAGGAHGFYGSVASLIDLRTGRTVAPDGVFRADWVAALAPLVVAKLDALDASPECREVPKPATLAEMLSKAGYYHFRADALEIAFQRYELGPGVCPAQSVTVDYAAIAALLRPDGPLAGRR